MTAFAFLLFCWRSPSVHPFVRKWAYFISIYKTITLHCLVYHWIKKRRIIYRKQGKLFCCFCILYCGHPVGCLIFLQCDISKIISLLIDCWRFPIGKLYYNYFRGKSTVTGICVKHVERSGNCWHTNSRKLLEFSELL